MSAGPVIQDELTVPNHMVGIIIGKGGDNLKKIERMSGAKVQFAGGMVPISLSLTLKSVFNC